MDRIENFIKVFNHQLSEINTIKNIENGGCGYFALYLYERLKELGFKNVYLRPFLYEDKGYTNNSDYSDYLKVELKAIELGEKNPGQWHTYQRLTDSSDHMVVHVKGAKHYLLDSSGVDTFDKPIKSGQEVNDMWGDYAIIGNIIPHSLFIEGIKIARWNRAYDKRQNKELKEIISKIG